MPGTQIQNPGTTQPGAAQTPGTTQPGTQTQVPGTVQDGSETAPGTKPALTPAQWIESLTAAIKKSGLTTGKATIAAQEMVTEAEKRFGANSDAVLDAYQPGQNPRQFLNGFQNAYILGTQGNQTALEKSKAAAYLTDEQRQTAFFLGEEARSAIQGNGDKSAELANRRQDSLENSGDNAIIKKSQRGAYNDKNDPYGSKRRVHAEQYYESVRNGKKDYVVRAISRNTGIDEEKISKMIDHVFINKYDLDKGHVRFDADYDIAESVRRLREGKNIQEHDLILIYHESLEYELMNGSGLKYEDAHDRANERYNYKEALEKWQEENEK